MSVCGARLAVLRAATALPLAVLIGWASAATAAPVTITDPRDENLRLLEVVLDGSILSEAIAAYAGPGGGTLLPLGLMSEILDIAIDVDSREGLATGFVLNEQRTFYLDMERGEVTISGIVGNYDASLVQRYPDDIYVDAVLLGEWLPIAFDVDLFALRLRVRPREPLPLQLRLERERMIRHWRLRLRPSDPGYPREPTSFRFWEMPTVDQTLRFSLTEDDSHATFSTYATGDLFFMESETFLSGSEEDLLETSRFTLRRRDPYGALGGWLQATELALGHVIYPRSSLLSQSSGPEPGILLTNLPLHRPDEFDRHSFHGHLPPGWDVELYHNDSLIDYQQSRPDGQFEFQDVPLLFGMNFFRLVFYGPQGQRREEEHRFLLGDSLTLPGRFEYRLVANTENEETRRGSMLLSYGISRHLTATAEVSSLPTELGDRSYGKLGLRTFWDALYAYGDYVEDETGGHAWEGGLQTRVYGVNLLLQRTGLSRDFVSESFPSSVDPILTIDRLRLDTAIPAWLLPRIPLSLQIEHQRLASGSERTVAHHRVTANYKGLSLSNLATWTVSTGEPDLLQGSFQMSRYIRRFGIRGELLYTLSPATASHANLTVERFIGTGYRVHANVSRSLVSDSHIYSIGVAKTAGSFAAGVETTRRPDGTVSADVNLAAGIGQEPWLGSWVAGAQSKAPFGAVSLRVFLDRNDNGFFDAGDELLPRIGITVNGVRRPERSTDHGVLYIDRLSPHLPADISVDTSTLEDPQWVPDKAGARIVPRPGKASTLDVPLIETSEIEGTVHTMRRGHQAGLAGVAVELVDSGGEIVQRTLTAYDGFYVLTHVRPGSYVVRVSPPRPVQLALQPGAIEKAVPIPVDAPFVIVIDFEVPSGEESPTVIAEQMPEPPGPPPIEPPPQQISETVPISEASPPSNPSLSRGEYVVQIGAFALADNARRRLEIVQKIVLDASIVRSADLHVVRSGPRTRSEAIALSRELESRGIESFIMRARTTGPRAGSANQPSFLVQLGAFSIQSNALDLVGRLEALAWAGRANIEKRGDLYFVTTGPYSERSSALAARDRLRGASFEAIVVSSTKFQATR